jgi:predicted RNase H-like HicB family nuclease
VAPGDKRGKIDRMLVKVEVYNDGEFWCARGIGEDVFTQAKTVDELYANMREAVS